MNKRTLALTTGQYKEIVTALKEGFLNCRPNNRIATALVIQSNLGLRISDILKLTLNSFVKDGARYRLDITEQKTSKSRTFTVPMEIYNYIKLYCLENSIKADETIFPITERAIQKQLKLVCEYLSIEGVSTHSFRKYYATEIYKNSGYNIALVRTLLQHSSVATTQKYIGVSSTDVEDAIMGHMCLM